MKRLSLALQLCLSLAALSPALCGCAAQKDFVPPIADAGPGLAGVDGGGSGGSSPDVPEGSAPDPAVEARHVRADDAAAAIMLGYFGALEAQPATTADNTLSQLWEAILDVADRRGRSAYRGTSRMFYDLLDQRGWLGDEYDHEAERTLALLHAYELSGESLYLDRAVALYADLQAGWDGTCCGDVKGGIWWRKSVHDGKLAQSNLAAVVAGAKLFQLTQQPLYLDFAQLAFHYWSQYMVEPQSGHVYHFIDSSGAKYVSLEATYDEGMFLGACVALYQVTHDPSYLALAHRSAGYLLAKNVATVDGGTILSDGKCQGDAAMWKGMTARWLGALYAADPTHVEYRDLLLRSAEAAFARARDPATGHISCDWLGPFDAATATPASLAAAGLVFAAAASATGPATARPGLEYEVEEGRASPGLLLEALYGGFTGWGYLAGWIKDGQKVELSVDVPAAGRYTATWRYAVADFDARRAVSVNGGQPVQLGFALTGKYTDYAEVTQNLVLAAGANTIVVSFDQAGGSTGYVNLDRLRLTPQ